MPRHKEFNQEQVLDKAMHLFWSNGYEATSVEDLVQCTGLGRGSLYDTFGDKHSLYLAALDRYQSLGGQELKALRNHPGPFLEALRSFFQARIAEAVNDREHPGCLMVFASIEMAPRDSEVAVKVQAAMAETEEAFYHVLIKAQAAGELPWKHDPHQFARYLVNALLGIKVLARANPDYQFLQDVVSTTMSALH